MSSPKRCSHVISINFEFLKKLLSEKGLAYANPETIIRFRNDINTVEDVKKLANWLLVHAADILKYDVEKVG